MSDSDETVGPDSDVTLPPSDHDGYNSPDLFVDSDKDEGGRKTFVLNKSQTKTHEMSDSDSDREISKQVSHSAERKSKSSRKSSPKPKGHVKKEYRTSPAKIKQNKSIEHTRESNGCEKRKFMDDFLNMSDSDNDSDQEYKRNQQKLLALKDKHVSKKVLEDDSTHRKHAVKINDRSNNDKNVSRDQSYLVNKPHKKDYSKPYKQDERSKCTNDNKSVLNNDRSRESPSSRVKRKHSRSPVPQELRKVVTEILNENKCNSASKKKTPCQYGDKCYRKNPSHFEEYSHPGDEESSPSKKKIKLDPGSQRTLSPSAASAKSVPQSEAKLNKCSLFKVRSSSPSTSKSSSDSPSSSKVRSRSPSRSTPSVVKQEVPSTSKVKTHSPTSDCKVKKRPAINPQTINEKFLQAQPYSFFLTKVSGISDKYNNTYAMDIKDLLSPSMGNLVASCQFNFMFDIGWLMKQYPSQFRTKPLLIVHGEQGASKNALQGQAIPYNNIKFCQAKLEIMYGTHHTKMMLLLYDNGLRIVIHTSNLIQQDWHQKTQGMWISPIFPKLSDISKDKGDSVTNFKRDLLEYIQAYKAHQLKEWIDLIMKHDMSSAKVVVVGSVPGRHVDRSKSLWGHMKLRKVLYEHGPSQETVKTWPMIGQFSSIGSMGPNKENWLCSEWKQSLGTTKSSSMVSSNNRLMLIFPSRHNVRLSLEGYPAGGSIPYTAKTAQKQLFLNDFFHLWKSEGRGRTRAMPHIKSYCRTIQDGSKAAWFIVTSANLSKAAWGALEKKGAQLMIRSYEIGVMFLPKFFEEGEVFPITSDPGIASTTNKLLLPYDLPPTLYDKKDRPWMWDIPYMDLPDTNGNVWCPFSK
ncbi:tyrosyl-DNA phosphodiesterase 1 [Mactra antiquata]